MEDKKQEEKEDNLIVKEKDGLVMETDDVMVWANEHLCLLLNMLLLSVLSGAKSLEH